MNGTVMVTVIVPVYNVEKYIKKCLLSIQDQTYKNFECIIVNDGTQDRSMDIARKTVGKDPRFIFYNKNNGGLSSARNFGLKYARGEYIAFVDSDDYVDKNFLKLPLEKILEEKADICLFGINYIGEDERLWSTKFNNLEEYYKKDDFLLSYGTILQFAWSKLYKKEVFNNVNFT